MTQIPDPSSDDFVLFIGRVTDESFVEGLAERSSLPVDMIRQRVLTAAGESAQTLRVLAGIDVAPGERILEVGAGLGLASSYLSSRGFDVTGLEPGGIGFEAYRTVSEHFADLVGSQHAVLGITAEELSVESHGRFALIFSNNVLEHVEDPGRALAALAGVTAPGGVMVHSCPNYSIPYEPHFGIPLIPMKPGWTARLLPSSIKDSSVWHSLNFIRARQVVSTAATLRLDVHFRSGALAVSLRRFATDPEFRNRHRVLGVVSSVARMTGVLALIDRLPATWSTPMDFMLCSPSTDQDRVEAWMS